MCLIIFVMAVWITVYLVRIAPLAISAKMAILMLVVQPAAVAASMLVNLTRLMLRMLNLLQEMAVT